jgi:nucleotide-binding universal stress UspA family protein
MQSILVATDGSQTSRAAVRFAIALALDAGAELHVLSVSSPTLHGDGSLPRSPTPHVEVRAAALIADAAADKARAAGVRAASHEAEGAEAAAIAAAAERLGVDLVVVGSHGRGGLTSALLGSVSRELVTRCTCPVTIVRAQREPVAAEA